MKKCRQCNFENPDHVSQCERCGEVLATRDEAEQPLSIEPASVLEAAILHLCRERKKIEAIKRFREATGAGLKESKEAVDLLCVRHGIPAGSGCAGVLLLVLSLLLLPWL